MRLCNFSSQVLQFWEAEYSLGTGLVSDAVVYGLAAKATRILLDENFHTIKVCPPFADNVAQ